MDDMDKETVTTLSELLPIIPPPGFHMLVRYVDTLCRLHAVPIVNLSFRCDDGKILEMDKAELLHHTRKSIVVQQSSSCLSVIKIGPRALMERELLIHNIVDDNSIHIRRCLQAGVIVGVSAGDEKEEEKTPLLFLELEGLGVPLERSLVLKNETFESYFNQAVLGLQHLHAKGVLHRDMKPSNIMLIDGVIKVNDFDCSCRLADNTERMRLSVGTAKYQSPFRAKEYTEHDDWISLILTFLSLRMDISNKEQALSSAMGLSWLPLALKACISKAISRASDKHGN